MRPSTTKRQRLFIMIILVAMVVGTLGSFAIMVLATQNDQQEGQRQQDAQAQLQKLQAEYQQLVDAQGRELSQRYYPIFKEYETLPAEFEIDSVEKLVKKDLKIGDGTTIDDVTPFATYYIGWNPDGKVFDGSFANGELKAPFPIESGLGEAGVIEGWIQGIKGMKIGGVRLLEIPSDLAYGEAGQGQDIPPNTPLKFVVMVIEKPEAIPFPDIPDSLIEEAYGNQQL